MYLISSRMSHSLIRFMENGQENEMEVSSNWVCGKKLVYPNSLKNTELFNKLADPQEDWKEYDLVRVIVTGDYDTLCIWPQYHQTYV